jgi:ankyrin repeat protein
LLDASEYGHLELVSLLVDRGANVNYVRPHEAQDYRIHASPLHLACKSNHLAVVSHLLSLGADVHLRINPVSQSDLLRLAGLLSLTLSVPVSHPVSLSLSLSLGPSH